MYVHNTMSAAQVQQQLTIARNALTVVVQSRNAIQQAVTMAQAAYDKAMTAPRRGALIRPATTQALLQWAYNPFI